MIDCSRIFANTATTAVSKTADAGRQSRSDPTGFAACMAWRVLVDCGGRFANAVSKTGCRETDPAHGTGDGVGWLEHSCMAFFPRQSLYACRFPKT